MKDLIRRSRTTRAPRSTLLIRWMVSLVFLSEGIQKFLFPDALGQGRFAKIGIPVPALTAPFVGVVEIVGGILLFVGWLTRFSSLVLFFEMCVALQTTKGPLLHGPDGFWHAAHEARTDWLMLGALVFLMIVGAGPLSLDAGHARRTQ